ncbi:CpsD/CapB family tyrosine-protein kinase [Mangrovibacillus cuniculi]|uniref:non-specific protein-tyrosine kinase n=1 Tax=Mangrovibacillus cuniculi TaxID=2593652 RepID=A0A7S8HGC5_9BACI|nr:CpsD/CapB family tyrosine-protein kinase [Mangrovibacillus cuniculi]QPC47662.1 CpsD/CapB family tyrosine-protein kinase [Mangrovibacillus cuniculi]
MFKKKKKSIFTTKRNIIAHIDPKSPISEQYRTLRTNITFSEADHPFQTILATSAGPGEGKSTTIANTAIVFAQAGKKVLLVDADMRKPTVHYTFQLGNHIGLTNVLTKQTTLDLAIQTSEVENLSVLTSGPVPPNPAELLGSNQFKELLETAKKHYDLILFDTPPVLAVADAAILGNVCDGIVLVIRSGQTEVEAAAKAKDLLEGAKAKIIGAVLNGRKASEQNYYYYYSNR